MLISGIFVPRSTSPNIPNNGSLLIKVVARVSLELHVTIHRHFNSHRGQIQCFPHDETQKNRCPGYFTALFNQSPIKRSTATRFNPGPLFVPWKFRSICDPFSGNKPLASRGSVKRRRTDGGGAGTGTGGQQDTQGQVAAG